MDRSRRGAKRSKEEERAETEKLAGLNEAAAEDLRANDQFTLADGADARVYKVLGVTDGASGGYYVKFVEANKSTGMVNKHTTDLAHEGCTIKVTWKAPRVAGDGDDVRAVACADKKGGGGGGGDAEYPCLLHVHLQSLRRDGKQLPGGDNPNDYLDVTAAPRPAASLSARAG